MDPDAKLAQLREHVKVITDEYSNPALRATHGEWLAEGLQELDEWLSQGGFKPSAWTVTRVPTAADDVTRELNAHPTWRERRDDAIKRGKVNHTVRRQSRRDDATHPRELPDPADETTAFTRRTVPSNRAYDETITTTMPWSEGDPCSLCGEDETSEDPLGHYVAADGSTYVMAHGQCGLDAGLKLA